MSRAEASKNTHSRYPGLLKKKGKDSWYFRKYSSERHAQFNCSTGLEATPRNAASAYKLGMERFNAWLGSAAPVGKLATVREIARIVLASKDDPTISMVTHEEARRQINLHVNPNFGHLRLDQVASRWRSYQTEERKRGRFQVLKDGTFKALPPRTKLFNTRKVLMEILRVGKEKGLIKEVPELELKDAPPKPPKYIPKTEILSIIRFAGRVGSYKRLGSHKSSKESRRRAVPMKLWVFIMWKQGARPTEILNYRYSMVSWTEGAHGMLSVPAAITKTRRARKIPLNPRVARILRFLHARTKQDLVFPSPSKPGEPMKEYKTAWGAVMRRLGLPYEPYNLRDTFITNGLKRGLSSTFIAKYCDNSATIIEQKYAVAVDDMMQAVASG